MSLSKQYELKGLHSLKSNTCGDGPWKPGRPKKNCSNVLKELRALCKKMEGHTYQKRVCRLKLKPGRKPKANKNSPGGFRTAAMGAASAMRKKTPVTPNAPPPSPASVRKTPKAPPPSPASVRKATTPRVSGCHTIRYTADEKRALKAPRTTPGTRQRLKNKCAGFKNVKGRTCRVDVPKGLCKAA